jgi:hypothetical protein
MSVDGPAARGAPRVSVLIPCRDQGRDLPAAVESVLAQTFQDFEILIVDDGSTEPATVALLDRFEAPATTILRTPPRGLARARNLLIERATGEFLCALDADDLLAPTFLERTVAAFESRPELTFVSTRLRMFGTETREWPDSSRCDLAALLAEDTVITAALVRRAAVVAAGGYDEHMPVQGNEDWALWIGLVERGGIGTILPDVLFYYRRREGSLCDVCSTGEPHLRTIEYLRQKHAASYQRHLAEVMELRAIAAGAYVRAHTACLRDISEREMLLTSLEAERARLSAAAALPAGRTATNEIDALRRALADSRREVDALRTSWSWRVTRPLRWLYDVSLGRRP